MYRGGDNLENATEVFDFGARLRELRMAKNLTPEQVCELTGISASTLNRYERNVQEPTRLYLMALAKVYNASIDYMVGFDDVLTLKLYGLNKKQQIVIRGFAKYFIDKVKDEDE